MSRFTSFRRLTAMASLLAGIGLVAVQPAAAETHAYWTSVISQSGACGVRTNMARGGELRLMVANNDVHLVARDPAWHMTANNTVRVSISIDGDRFNGTATALDSQTLVVENLTEEFLDEFIAGQTMLADFGGVRWTLDLTGSSDATSDMIDCARHPRSGVMS